jgi:hypothetical protein
MLSLVFWAWAIGALGALLAVPLSLLARALLIEADPAARWALPLVSGRVHLRGKEPPDDDSEAETVDEQSADEPAPVSSTGGDH